MSSGHPGTATTGAKLFSTGATPGLFDPGGVASLIAGTARSHLFAIDNIHVLRLQPLSQ